MRPLLRPKSFVATLSLFLAVPVPGTAQKAAFDPKAGVPEISERTSGMEKIDGFFPLYWEELAGKLWMEIPRLNEETLYLSGISAGLGSNDIGLDRGAGTGSQIVRFERIGPKVLMVQPNYRFRASSGSPDEVRAVEEAFAPSVLWGFEVAAASSNSVLVEITPFLLRDSEGFGRRLGPGDYRFDPSRSAVYRGMTMGFPNNTELEVSLTFVRQPGEPGVSSFRRSAFEGVGDVAANLEAATLRVHHSFVALPDGEYRPRPFDPRAGYMSAGFVDYSAPLGESMTKRFLVRHRLEKLDPSLPESDPVKPIVYYLDPGTPEPIRSALLEGARWWDEAFEAAGYRNAFRVEIRPPDISPHDVRYNVINWVHRSTRGWSYGGSIVDPRTGEIIKGAVTLGSLRVRQDYLIAEGLLSPYESGEERPPELAEWALARIRQLSAHEVGHTLGLSHNYFNSTRGRISVMDYPHPLITLKEDGSLDSSVVYDVGIGEWDKVTIVYGYQDFPEGSNEAEALLQVLESGWEQDLQFLTNQDIEITPSADQWSNGVDPAAELNRMMDVRRAALERFGEKAIQKGQPLAQIEEVFVPLYLHHRYQVEATASALGGLDFVYALRGDGRPAYRRVRAEQQRAALGALLRTLQPEELALPASLIALIPPRPAGFESSRELFPRYTGAVFDVITPATVAADHTLSHLLEESRAARLVEQSALDPALPGLQEVLEELVTKTFPGVPAAGSYEAEVRRAVQAVLFERLVDLAARAEMPQVRALVRDLLRQSAEELRQMAADADLAFAAHYLQLASDAELFLQDPSSHKPRPRPVIPPGAPIGEPPY